MKLFRHQAGATRSRSAAKSVGHGGSITSSRRARGRLIATFAAALALAVPAFGATPSQIYKDYADNGTLDANYSKADLTRAVHDASVQGYGSPVVVAKMKQKKKPTGGVAGRKSPPGAVKAEGGLPFTGAQLGLFTIVGLALVGSGFLLRLTERKKCGAKQADRKRPVSRAEA
jgi:hypothetical protein